MKKLLVCILVLTLFLQNPLTSLAAEYVADATEQTLLEKVAEIMHNYNDDPPLANGKLEEIGFYLEGEPTAVTYTEENNARAYLPSNYTITLYHTTRGTNGLTHYLMWELDRTWAWEINSNPLDFISLEWDSTYASYYSSSSDGEITTKKSVANGIVLFNIEDIHFGDVDYAWGSVRVNRVQSGDMLYASKYVHTYNEYKGAGTVTANLNFDASLVANAIPSLTIQETRGFSVVLTGTVQSWELIEDKWAEI